MLRYRGRSMSNAATYICFYSDLLSPSKLSLNVLTRPRRTLWTSPIDLSAALFINRRTRTFRLSVSVSLSRCRRKKEIFVEGGEKVEEKQKACVLHPVQAWSSYGRRCRCYPSVRRYTLISFLNVNANNFVRGATARTPEISSHRDVVHMYTIPRNPRQRYFRYFSSETSFSPKVKLM